MLENLEKKIGIKFNNLEFLEQALTHRSYLNEHRDEKLVHNERLEFLGDAVLEIVISRWLYIEFPDEPEGKLTAFRGILVNTKMLSQVAKRYGLGEFIQMSTGQTKDSERAMQYLMACSLEAVIGAIDLDRGEKVAETFINRSILTPNPKSLLITFNHLDAKSLFQEKCQACLNVTPHYEVLGESGRDHDKVFTVGLYIGKELVARGMGQSKKDAETSAAKESLVIKGWNHS